MQDTREQEGIGCGWQIVIAFAVLVVVTIVLGSRMSSQLPSDLRVVEEIEASSEGFFMEACVYTAYRLDSATVRRIRASGMSYLDTIGPPRGASQPYSDWHPTPGTDETRRALGATSCSSSESAGRLAVGEVLRRPGSYYSLSQNGEGMMVVDPGRGLAWFLYFG